jgi:alpha-methylacyl-CoA racemase
MEIPPLKGLRVLDLSRLLPGPYCTRILSHFGAEVIRIEPLEGGDWLRDAGALDASMDWLYQALNLGKKSMKLNLKMEEGKRIFLQLVETADVLFEMFRPGVMDRLGLGYEELSKVNPRLIYCSLTGYGTEGPYRDRVGHDLNYIGLTGLLDLTWQMDGPPIIPGTQVADIMGGLWAVIGILTALQSRQTTDRGMKVDGSLLGAALASLPVEISRKMGGKPMGRGAGNLSGGLVCYNIYETKDGEYMTLAALEPKFWRNFCEAIGRDDLLGEQFAPAITGKFAYEELRVLFRLRTREEWINLLDGVETCCEPVQSLEGALVSGPIQSLGMLWDNGLSPPIRLSIKPESVEEDAPKLGQHTDELLRELGYIDAELVRLRSMNVI